MAEEQRLQELEIKAGKGKYGGGLRMQKVKSYKAEIAEMLQALREYQKATKITSSTIQVTMILS